MKARIVFIACIFLGAFSWAICPLLSNTFEPFDSDAGFAVGQSVMLIFMVYVGWSTSFKHILYAYALGGS